MAKEIAVLEKQIEDLKNKNVIALGEHESFALTSDDGQVKAFKRVVNLSVQEGTLVKIGYGNNATVIVSAQGFEKWADSVGANVIFPKDVMVGSKLQPNPYVQRDEKNGRILAVHARAIAFKFSAMGLPQVTDWSTIFDVPSYRMIDLLAKAKKTPQAFKLLPEGMEPEAKNNETWTSYSFDESTKLWLNTSHNEVLDWYGSIINREKKAMDFAQTFARRNALKHLSAIQKAPSEQWSFSVIAWKPTGNNIVQWNAAQYSQLQDRVSGMIEGDSSQFSEGETKQLEIKKGRETISAELDEPEINDDVNDADPVDVEHAEREEVEKMTSIKEPEQQDEDVPKEILQTISLKNQFENEYHEACGQLDIVGDPKDFTVEQCISIGKKVNELIDVNNEVS